MPIILLGRKTRTQLDVLILRTINVVIDNQTAYIKHYANITLGGRYSSIALLKVC